MNFEFQGQETGLSRDDMQQLRVVAEKLRISVNDILKVIFGDITEFMSSIVDALLDIENKPSYQLNCKKVFHQGLVIKKIIPTARSNCGAYLAPP